MFFAGVVGRMPDGAGNRILLRWYSLEGTPPYETFTVYRKAGDKTSAEPYAKITQVTKIRNINTIRSIFEAPGSEPILNDIKDILTGITRTPVAMDTYAQKLIETLDGGCDTCGFTNTMFAQVNWGVAIVEGLGYVDDVGSGIWTYELHAVDDAGDESLIVGRITVDAGTVTTLPAPVTAIEVPLPGERGHLRACLRWDIPPELQERLPLAFGFDVYRKRGPHDLATPFEDLLESGVITKVNERPVIVLSPTPEGEDPNEVYYFCDDNKETGETGPVGEGFTPGEQYTYYATARDLFGQRGEESNPVEVTIRDQRSPDVPKNPRTRVVEDAGGDRRVELVWDRNTDDTVSYNIYRYREYNHAGEYGPFTPIDGLAEGFVGSIAQPPSGEEVAYTDTALSESLHANRAFWYCLSAVDGAAPPNESPLSQPFRGVLHDTVPPDPAQQTTLCVRRVTCAAEYNILGTNDQTGQASALFQIYQGQSRVRRVVISRFYPGQDQVQVFDGTFPADGRIIFEDLFIAPGTLLPYWIFDLYVSPNERCGSMTTGADLGKYFERGRIIQVVTRIDMASAVLKHCVPDKPGVEPHVPADGGVVIPFQVDVPQVGDATGAILYRADDCEHFHPVNEVYFGAGSSATLSDYFNPHVSTEACYAIRTFDENHNLSPFRYLQRKILFLGAPVGMAPALKTITSIGDRSTPVARVEWFGPTGGVASYILNFEEIPADPSLPRNESRKPVSVLFYDNATSTFTGEIQFIDDDSATPITPDIPYAVKVIALDYSGNEVASGTKAFTWTDVPVPPEELDWPIRPLPPTVAGPSCGFDPTLGVLILVGDTNQMKQKINDRLYYDRPFIIYRKRVDIPNQEYQQISPLIEEINTDPSGMELFDPFFHLDQATYVYYLDNVALVDGARYEYKIVTYDDVDEIAAVHGPSTEVTVSFP
jgi:hypothetical protein